MVSSDIFKSRENAPHWALLYRYRKYWFQKLDFERELALQVT